MAIDALMPRSLEYWKLNLGLDRVRIQGWQTKRQILRRVSPKSPKIDALNLKIIAAQSDGLRRFVAATPIMVVDDCAALLGPMAEQLRSLGFTNVRTYADPQQAIDDYQASKEKPRIVITDLDMPGINGTRLIEEIALASRTSPKFIIFSGHALPADPDHLVNRMLAQYSADFIQKGTPMDEFNERLIHTAKGIALGTPPETEIISTKTMIDMDKNPYLYFMGRIIHDYKNVAASPKLQFDMATRKPESFNKKPLVRMIGSAINFIDALQKFVARNDFQEIDKVEATALPLNYNHLEGDQEKWQQIRPEDRCKLAAVIDQFLKGQANNGLLAFKSALEDIQAELAIPGGEPIDYKSLKESLSSALAQLEIINRAARLEVGSDPEMSAIFINYFQL